MFHRALLLLLLLLAIRDAMALCEKNSINSVCSADNIKFSKCILRNPVFYVDDYGGHDFYVIGYQLAMCVFRWVKDFYFCPGMEVAEVYNCPLIAMQIRTNTHLYFIMPGQK